MKREEESGYFHDLVVGRVQVEVSRYGRSIQERVSFNILASAFWVNYGRFFAGGCALSQTLLGPSHVVSGRIERDNGPAISPDPSPCH